MTFDEWVVDFVKRARADDDDERLRMLRFETEGYSLRETDPDRALALFEEGRRLALALNEPWWAMFYEHSRTAALIHFRRDYSNVLEMAVRAALEVRKPLYDQFPLRTSVFDDLIAAYLGIDPSGYAGEIRQAIASVEGILPDGPDGARYLLLARRRLLAIELNQFDDAFAVTEQELALADADPDKSRSRHFSVFIYDTRCEIAHRRGDWEALDQAAAAGEEVARQVGHQLELSEILLWQALSARRSGDEEKARRLYRTAAAKLGRLKMPPKKGGYDALAGYHEMAGDLAAALSVRDQELRTVLGKGRLAYETRCRIVRCGLLARLGRPLDEELKAGREAAARLRNPAPELEKLEHVAGGKTAGDA